MEQPSSVESGAEGASEPQEKPTTLRSSPTKRSKTTLTESPDITPADRLAMIQTVFSLAKRIPGVQAKRGLMYSAGQQTAVVILEGCIWTEDGNLEFISKQADNA